MGQHQRVFLFVLAVLMVQSTMVPSVAAQFEGGAVAVNRSLEEVGRFTYRASFHLEDGTEIFLVRSSFQITFLFQHHDPVIRQHFYSASLGFYYGKTMMGRSIVQSVDFDSFAFYPKWLSSAGQNVNLLDDTSLIEIKDTVNDEQLAYGFMLIDRLAVTKYISMFGGTFVFTDLTITLDDGLEIEFGEQRLQIEMEQHANEYVPEEANLSSGIDLEADFESSIININTGAAVPMIVYVDMVLGIFLIGTGIVLLGLVILHVKGKIVLPIERVKGVLSRNPPAITE